ncbi:hypothetical protein HYPSUDRAFT_206898 [Hypholoma sublateritium FD-334 SS-4]|uniref:Uncharacterized protein n=1 Tax=Hypholoma sublateritium (strain FD-334 SS-4) TaxID=945553 RepID=A0A0D2P8D7_HYPSF|nr:hypothetical protein HYPSUDRAFT_206898 [Hypholoma sublateritium FD-334 SS-4]
MLSILMNARLRCTGAHCPCHRDRVLPDARTRAAAAAERPPGSPRHKCPTPPACLPAPCSVQRARTSHEPRIAAAGTMAHIRTPCTHAYLSVPRAPGPLLRAAYFWRAQHAPESPAARWGSSIPAAAGNLRVQPASQPASQAHGGGAAGP